MQARTIYYASLRVQPARCVETVGWSTAGNEHGVLEK